MARPKINVKPVASHYAARDERIVEFTSTVGGGLISLRVVGERLRVEFYRTDDTVDVVHILDHPTRRPREAADVRAMNGE